MQRQVIPSSIVQHPGDIAPQQPSHDVIAASSRCSAAEATAALDDNDIQKVESVPDGLVLGSDDDYRMPNNASLSRVTDVSNLPRSHRASAHRNDDDGDEAELENNVGIDNPDLSHTPRETNDSRADNDVTHRKQHSPSSDAVPTFSASSVLVPRPASINASSAGIGGPSISATVAPCSQRTSSSPSFETHADATVPAGVAPGPANQIDSTGVSNSPRKIGSSTYTSAVVASAGRSPDNSARTASPAVSSGAADSQRSIKVQDAKGSILCDWLSYWSTRWI